ncbi:thermonuclease family protein [Pararhizobium sp. BT-229]|uniref:thermonuclease family protein n=1 Tax=Pararhizobium sp. BT-229 TaxID=2986923 RepID=UPI0021F748D9|nr:thermonuclease family protein [Pararhizobium sp. BT-229]MCV9962586.1 thermonuclease family protein [Pararhizobium sp. BT-229]
MKRHLLTAGGGLLGIFLTVVLLESGASVIQARQSAATPEFTLETPDLTDVPDLGDEGMDTGNAEMDRGETVPDDPAQNGTVGDKSIRDIAPEQFGLGEDVTTQPLERIEARQPLSDAVAKPEPELSVLRHPVALAAGLIRFDDGRVLQLDGLVPQDADRTCDDNGKSWPCGAVARTAFRNFLRARALVCAVPKDGWQGTLSTKCSIGNSDPALWLAENGWAEATAGSPLAEAVETAKKSRLGFFGDDPRDFSAPPLDEVTVPGMPDAGTDKIQPDL